VLRVPLFGAGPLFPVAPHPTSLDARHGARRRPRRRLVATALTALLYGCEDQFARLRIHWMWCRRSGRVRRAGWADRPRALGVGYDVIHDLLAGQLVGTTLVVLLVVKALIWRSGSARVRRAPRRPAPADGECLGRSAPPCFTPPTPLFGDARDGGANGGTMQIPFTAMVFAVELTATCPPCRLAHRLRRRRRCDGVADAALDPDREARAPRAPPDTRIRVNPLRVLRVEDVMDPRWRPPPRP